MTTAPASSVASAAPATGLGAFLTQILSDRDRFFSEVVEGEGLRGKLVHALWTLIGLSALYGAAAGAYASPAQSVSAAIKGFGRCPSARSRRRPPFHLRPLSISPLSSKS